MLAHRSASRPARYQPRHRRNEPSSFTSPRFIAGVTTTALLLGGTGASAAVGSDQITRATALSIAQTADHDSAARASRSGVRTDPAPSPSAPSDADEQRMLAQLRRDAKKEAEAKAAAEALAAQKTAAEALAAQQAAEAQKAAQAKAEADALAAATARAAHPSPADAKANALFIKAAVKPAQQGYREYRVPASVTIAQAILESGWGRSKLTANDRNYFGIKCFDGNHGPIATGCHDYATEECLPDCAPTTASFRTYASITDSFRDHGRFLAANSRYAPAFGYTTNPDQFLAEMWKAGYATDPAYVASVQVIMKQYNLYQYDKF